MPLRLFDYKYLSSPLNAPSQHRRSDFDLLHTTCALRLIKCLHYSIYKHFPILSYLNLTITMRDAGQEVLFCKWKTRMIRLWPAILKYDREAAEPVFKISCSYLYPGVFPGGQLPWEPTDPLHLGPHLGDLGHRPAHSLTGNRAWFGEAKTLIIALVL